METVIFLTIYFSGNKEEIEMEKLDLIKSAHVIDYHLQTLSAEITGDVLKEKILSVQAEWKELAYSISAHLSGVEAGVQSSAPKKCRR